MFLQDANKITIHSISATLEEKVAHPLMFALFNSEEEPF